MMMMLTLYSGANQTKLKRETIEGSLSVCSTTYSVFGSLAQTQAQWLYGHVSSRIDSSEKEDRKKRLLG